VNVILGGTGDDRIVAPFGTNIILGDNGQVNVVGAARTSSRPSPRSAAPT
jgi:hypothetical protein